jgi:Putative DNA-binding domain
MPLLYPLNGLASWQSGNLMALPQCEDESHEYKSSATKFEQLKPKIASAASAFWNSGGGLFVAGIDKTGKLDGGVDRFVGNQPVRDWVDQCLAAVAPRGDYRVATIGDDPASPCTLVIGFAESHLAPHMAPDNYYYIRAGAHTVKAPHFVVEALMARRGLTQPILRPVVRHKPGTVRVVQLGIVAVSSAPALDAVIDLPPLAWISGGSQSTTLNVSVIGPQAPYFFDFHIETLSGDSRTPPFTMKVSFKDVASRTYAEQFEIDVEKQLGHQLGENNPSREVADAIRSLHGDFKDLANAVKNGQDTKLQGALKDIQSGLKDVATAVKSADAHNMLKDLTNAVKAIKLK